MSDYPTPMCTPAPIRVGTRHKLPVEWAVELAPQDELAQYKDAIQWFEGDDFETTEQFLAEVKKVIANQKKLKLIRDPTVAAPALPQETKSDSPSPKESKSDSPFNKELKSDSPLNKELKSNSPEEDNWPVVMRKRKPRGPRPQWTIEQLAEEVIERCLDRFIEKPGDFRPNGPRLYLSEVYPWCDEDGFTTVGLMDAIERVKVLFPLPCKYFGWLSKAAYYSAGSQKIMDFNFKVVDKDDKAIYGWSAKAQIHVIWPPPKK